MQERKTKPPKTPSFQMAVYMGPKDIAERRMASLDRMADRLGINRSKLIQMIADGRLALSVPNDWAPAEGEGEEG